MIRKFTKKIINFITENKYSLEECQEMEYMLNTIIFELLKTVTTIVLCTLAGYFKESLILLISTCAVRPFIGGYHEDSQARCFLATLLFTVLELVLSLNTYFSFSANLIIILICVFCIYEQAPVINPNMPITRLQSIKDNRKKGLAHSIILGVISIALHSYCNYYSLITWTLLINTLLMFNKNTGKNEER